MREVVIAERYVIGAGPRRRKLSIFKGTGYLNGIVGKPSSAKI